MDNNLEKEEDYSEEIKMVDIINAFQVYYKKLFNKKQTDNMFSELNESDPLATNRQMEFLYEHIYKYKENEKEKNNKNNLFNEEDEFNLDNYDEFFALIINGEINKLSASLFALMAHLVNIQDAWYELSWSIMNLKNN
jgi:hypothetical protein